MKRADRTPYEKCARVPVASTARQQKSEGGVARRGAAAAAVLAQHHAAPMPHASRRLLSAVAANRVPIWGRTGCKLGESAPRRAHPASETTIRIGDHAERHA